MTLSKNGKKMGRPVGSKNKPKDSTNDRLNNQSKIISALQRTIKELNERCDSYSYENFQLRQEIESSVETFQGLRAELHEAKVAFLDSSAIIRYLERKIFELAKAS